MADYAFGFNPPYGLFPVEVAVALDIIRTDLPAAIRLLDSYPADTIIEISSIGISYSDALRPYVDTCERIQTATGNVIASLGLEVTRIRDTLK